MSFIDSTYFVGEINIPNAATESSLTQAIPQYEKEILIMLLGYPLYKLLMADCTLSVPASQIYKDLVNGVEFDLIYNGETITLKWEGLGPLIAYYVFFKYLERDVTRLYPSGVGQANGNDWNRVSPMNKLCYIWDRMRELYGKLPIELKPNTTIKGSLFTHSYDSDPSALNFLYTKIIDYPDWIFTPQWNINAFNI
jgi:hypothetical protein